MGRAYVTLEGYTIKATTVAAIGLAKGTEPELTWVPRSCCQDGDTLDRGDTDICVREDMAESKGLSFE